MRERAEDLRRDGLRIAVVPTMGYLHSGHLSLLEAARARADIVILTIFVNPSQFGPAEDLASYPRDEPGDIARARTAGIDLAFCPDAQAMYPTGYQTHVTVDELARPLCGVSRPHHFRGVATVVCKLFHITRPHLAVFGQKDYQQFVVVRQMVRDLDLGIDIVGMPIVREADGLAMSSRNVYLSPEERHQAVCLHHGLESAQKAFHDQGERDPAALLARAHEAITRAPLARIDYVELRDADTLAPVTSTIDRPVVLAMAVFFGKTRLIDNAVLG